MENPKRTTKYHSKIRTLSKISIPKFVWPNHSASDPTLVKICIHVTNKVCILVEPNSNGSPRVVSPLQRSVPFALITRTVAKLYQSSATCIPKGLSVSPSETLMAPRSSIMHSVTWVCVFLPNLLSKKKHKTRSYYLTLWVAPLTAVWSSTVLSKAADDFREVADC